MPAHVVIAGGGFGGFYTARRLERLLPADARITLINDTNFMLYTPLLPGAAAGTLEPRHVVMPLRERLKRTELRVGKVTGGDPATSTLDVELLTGNAVEYRYDQLVVALGSVSRTFPIPGLKEHAIGLKTIAEAVAVRDRVVEVLETAEEIDELDARRDHLGFVFVGAGYAGLEGVAELQDFAVDALRYYPRCREVGMRWLLVDAAGRIMPEIQPSLARFTAKLLTKRGIEIRLETQVTNVTEDSVTLSTGEVVPCRLLCWTAGVTASPIATKLGLPLEHGRIVCDEQLRVQGLDNVWALGDIAAVPDPARPGEPCPPTAQHAIRQGKLMANNVAAELGVRGRLKPFTFKTLGAFAELGRQNAVANLMGARVRGFPAWVVARFYHLAWMPGFTRKARLIADWTVDFWFQRDTSYLEQLQPVVGLGEHAVSPARDADGEADS